MPAGYVVLVAACLVTALVIPVAQAWTRLRSWRRPPLKDTVVREQVDGPFPAPLVALWSKHDPSHLGFHPLGVVRAGEVVRRDGLSHLWADGATVAAVTCRPSRSGGWVVCRRGFITFLGESGAPHYVGTVAHSSAIVQGRRGSSVHVLCWPSADQSALLAVHRRQMNVVSLAPLPVSSLDDFRSLLVTSQTVARARAFGSGRIREDADGRVALTARGTLLNLRHQLPTPRMARRRADRLARRVVASWPDPLPLPGKEPTEPGEPSS